MIDSTAPAETKILPSSLEVKAANLKDEVGLPKALFQELTTAVKKQPREVIKQIAAPGSLKAIEGNQVEKESRLFKVGDFISQLRLPVKEQERFLENTESMKQETGYRGSFRLDINEPGFSNASLRVNISPSREMMRQFLTTDSSAGDEVPGVYKASLEDEGLKRIIEINVLGEDNTIIGTHELHIIDNDGELIAVDPIRRLHLGFAIDLDRAEKLGDLQHKEKLARINNRISLDEGEQWYKDAVLVNRSYRRKGVGGILFRAGTVVAKLLDAKKRVVWTDATSSGGNPESYYTRFGAVEQNYQYQGQDKKVPVLSLK